MRNLFDTHAPSDMLDIKSTLTLKRILGRTSIPVVSTSSNPLSDILKKDIIF